MIDAKQLAAAEDSLSKVMDVFRAAGELKEVLRIVKSSLIESEDATERVSKSKAEILTSEARLVELRSEIAQASAVVVKLNLKIAKAQEQLGGISL